MQQQSPEESDCESVQVKPMLTTANKNFKQVNDCPTILSGDNTRATAVSREDLPVPGSRCFLLHNLLTPEECLHYIEETERVGYSDLSQLFSSNYRSNDRVLSLCQPLVDCLWERIQPHLTRREVIRVRPIGFGNQGTWKPFRLNECCKFGRYRAGGHFSPHMDGPWVPREDESSVFTVVLYLNSDFQGGETNFLQNNSEKVVCSVTPKTGTALLFNHDTLHEGQPATAGSKYILRTEVMYRRVDTEMLLDPLSYLDDANYLRTLTLYQKSHQLEKEGDIEGFTDTYLEAIGLQYRSQRSIGAESVDLFEQQLPYELFLRIFGNLSVKDLCNAMVACKLWYDMCMDGQLWYELYKRRWPIGISLEAHNIDHTLSDPVRGDEGANPFLRDWYGLYKQRVLMKQPKKVMVVDPGSHSFKCAVLNLKKGSIQTWSRESVIAAVSGIHDLHMRQLQYSRIYSGKQARENFPNDIKEVVKEGKIVLPEYLPEILTCFYLDCSVRPKITPVVILEPPGLWSCGTGKGSNAGGHAADIKEKIARWFVKAYLQPNITFISSAVATLCHVGISSGVVLDVGCGVVTCASVWKGRELVGSLSCQPSEANVRKLVEMVQSVVQSCDQSMKAKLQSSVTITGGEAKKFAGLVKSHLEKDSSFSVHITDDLVFGAVKGGAVFAALSGFPSSKKYDVSEIEKKKTLHFYYNALHYTVWGQQIELTRSSFKKENKFFYKMLMAENSEGERFCLSDSSDDELPSPITSSASSTGTSSHSGNEILDSSDEDLESD